MEVRYIVAVSCADLVKIVERASHRGGVRAAIVFETVLLEQGLDAILHKGNAKLWHCWEQMMLDLEVEICYTNKKKVSAM